MSNGSATPPAGQHVVWDWNGTLFDDFPMLLASANAAFAALGGPEIDADAYRSQFARPVRDFYARIVGRPLDDAEWATVDDVFHDHYDSLLHSAGLASDCADALEAVAAHGHTQSLLSMWRHERLDPHVHTLEIHEHFLRVDGLRGDAGGPKEPHLRAHLETVRALHPGSISRIVVVGDTVDDAHAAQAIGVDVVLYAGGEMPEARLAAAGVPVTTSLLDALVVGGVISSL